MRAIAGFLLTMVFVLVMVGVVGHAPPENALLAAGLSVAGLLLWWPLWRRYGWNTRR